MGSLVRRLVVAVGLVAACGGRTGLPRRSGARFSDRVWSAYVGFRWAVLQGDLHRAMVLARAVLRRDTRACLPAIQAASLLGDLGRPADGLLALRNRCRDARREQWHEAVALRARLAWLAGRRRAYERARGRLARCGRVECRFALSEVCGLARDWACQSRSLDAVLSGQADHAGALFRRIRLERLRGRAQDAVRWARRAVRLRPEYLAFHAELVRSLVLAGRIGEAERVLVRARLEAPADEALLALAVRLALGQGRRDRAHRVVRELDTLGRVDALVAEARWLWQMGSFEEAHRVARRAVSLSRTGETLALAAGTALRLGRVEEAERLAREAARVGEDPTGLFALAWSAVSGPGCRQMLGVFRALPGGRAWVCGSKAAVRVGVALLEVACGVRSRGLAVAKRLRRDCGYTSPVHGWLEGLLEVAGAGPDLVAGARFYYRANPMDPAAANSYAYFLAEFAGKAREALPLARQALRLSPLSPETRDTLGYCYLELGRLNEARRHLEAAARLSPADGVIAYHLARAYDLSARREARGSPRRRQWEEKARATYARALALGLVPRLRSKAKVRLRVLRGAGLQARR